MAVSGSVNEKKRVVGSKADHPSCY